MTVTQSVQLPDQPTIGTVSLLPLAGDGYSAPHSYFVVDIDSVQDASGGSAIINVEADPRFASYCAMCEVEDTDTTPKKFQIIIRPPNGPSFSADKISTDAISGAQVLMFMPPPLFPINHWEMRTANVDTFTFSGKMWILNWRIDAPTRVPFPLILAGMPQTSGWLA